MRRTTHQSRAGQDPARNANDESNRTIRVTALNTIRRGATYLGPALLLVAGLLTLSGARPLPVRASAHALVPPIAYAALRPDARKSGGGPDQRFWLDPSNGTAYSVWVTEDRQGLPGQFIFTLPNGDQIIGGIGHSPDPIQPSPTNDGSLVQASNCGDSVPDFGLLVPAGSSIADAQLRKTVQEVAYVMQSHLDATDFMAYATLDYTTFGNQDNLCSESAPYPYVVQAGCDLKQCRDPVASATQDAQHYDDAVVNAARDGGAGAWQAVWPLTATFIRGQYAQSDFGNAMAAQERSVGRITQITNTSTPDVQLDVGLQPFCSVTQDVTVSKDGKNTVSSITSYFLLEGEQWQFWFSAS